MMKRFARLLKENALESHSSSTRTDGLPEGDTPEAKVARSVKLFCETPSPDDSYDQGNEVLQLPIIVAGAEESPTAAAIAAEQIRKYLSMNNVARPNVPYNAIVLIRILADNPGPTFTRNIDSKFVFTIQSVLRSCQDRSIQAFLRKTIEMLYRDKAHDNNLANLFAMWSKESRKPNLVLLDTSVTSVPEENHSISSAVKRPLSDSTAKGHDDSSSEVVPQDVLATYSPVPRKEDSHSNPDQALSPFSLRNQFIDVTSGRHDMGNASDIEARDGENLQFTSADALSFQETDFQSHNPFSTTPPSTKYPELFVTDDDLLTQEIDENPFLGFGIGRQDNIGYRTYNACERCQKKNLECRAPLPRKPGDMCTNCIGSNEACAFPVPLLPFGDEALEVGINIPDRPQHNEKHYFDRHKPHVRPSSGHSVEWNANSATVVGSSAPHSMLGIPIEGSSKIAVRSADTELDDQLKAKRRRRRESHNLVERRRRDNINERIAEMAKLIPAHRLRESHSTLSSNKDKDLSEEEFKPNKGDILHATVSWIRDLLWAARMSEEYEAAITASLIKLGGKDFSALGSTPEGVAMKAEIKQVLEDVNISPTTGFKYSRPLDSRSAVPLTDKSRLQSLELENQERKLEILRLQTKPEPDLILGEVTANPSAPSIAKSAVLFTAYFAIISFLKLHFYAARKLKYEDLGRWYESLVDFLHRRCERTLDPKKRRVRWKCRCGKRLYDDFIELEHGGIAALQASLNQVYSQAGTQSGTAGNARGGSNLRMLRYLQQLIHPRQGIRNIEPHGSLPFHETQNAPDDRSKPSPSSDEEIFDLNLLIQRGRYANSFVPLDLRHIQSDQDVFNQMRASRERTVNRWCWLQYFNLRALRRIQFVQFVMHKLEYVDVKKVDDIPPHDKLGEYKYVYTPTPAKYIPPVGTEYMTHLYHHPDHAENNRGVLLPLFPKKIEERLAVCKQQGMCTGWGVQFLEGWNWVRILTLAFVLFTVGSMTFAVAWWKLEHDLQGAFGVASYISTFLALTVGLIQVRLQSG